MVSIPDFESGNPGSNPGETLYLYSSVEECLAHNQEDQGSKPCGEEEFNNFYPVLCGREKWVIKIPRDTMTFT